MSKPFEILNLPTALIDNLNKMGYTKMSPIQEKALPLILNKKDLIAQAKTGSGKTAAFGIGSLLNIDKKMFKPQVLIMTPTRELAQQVHEELKLLARFIPNFKITSLIGGIPKRVQTTALNHGTHIVIGTPGRLNDHIDTNSLNLDEIKILVLDEADKMIEMGFMEQIERIIAYSPSKRQTLLFSATFPDKIKSLSQDFMNRPEHIKVDTLHEKNTIKSYFYQVPKANKLESIIRCLNHFNPNSSIIFANTKVDVKNIVSELKEMGFSANGLHGDLEQADRNEVLLQFENQSTLILVATDVASRGIDIKDLECVINYDLPYDPEVYTHRIGRTGRAGEKGIAISFVSDKSLNILDDYLYETLKENYQNIEVNDISQLSSDQSQINKPPMITLCISGGKRDKLSKGDILGGLTGKIGLQGSDIGKIHIQPNRTYIAIKRARIDDAFNGIKKERIKKKKFQVWEI